MAVSVASDITRLIVVYSHALDDQDFVRLGAMFAPDATMRFNEREMVGREAIVDEIRKIQPEQAGKHLVGTPVIDILDDALARAWTDMVIVLRPEGAWGIAGLARYQDTVTKIGGRWLFQRREMLRPGAHAQEVPAPWAR